VTVPTAVPPGYYPDPGGSSQLRWWDGVQWTQTLSAAPVTVLPQPGPTAWTSSTVGPAGQPRRGRSNGLIIGFVAGLTVLVLVAVFVGFHVAQQPVQPPVAQPAIAGPSTSARPNIEPGLIAPTTPEPPAGQPVITQPQAASVVQDYWPLHESALQTGDTSQLRRIDTGAGATYQVGGAACGCLWLTHARPIVATEYFVPEQTAYPAHFLVMVQTNADSGAPFVDLLVFVKAAALHPWLVEEDSGYEPVLGQSPTIGEAPDDGLFAAPSSAAMRAREATLAPRLAALWQQAKVSGKVPAQSTFEITSQTFDRFNAIVQHRQGTVQDNQLVAHFQFFVDPADPLFTFAAGDVDVACRAIRETVVYSSPTGAPLDQDAAQQEWGRSLPSGTYPSVTSRDAWQTCFVVPQDPTGRVIVLDQDLGGSLASAH
jgi:Protein of unknown function (DUF2510)